MSTAVSKVIYNSDTLIDLTQDTVSPDKLLSGVTAHDASGKAIVGTYDPNAKVRPAFTNIYSASTRVYPYTIGTSSSLTPFASQQYLKSEHIASGTSINSTHYYFQAMYYEMDGSATATFTLSSDKTFVTPTGTSTLSGSGWAYCCGKSMSVNSTQFGISSSNCTGNGTITYLYCIDLTALVDAGTITSTDINDAIELFGELPLVPGQDYDGSSGGSSGGIDTSDATATASDIASGKTAYVKGSKITGDLVTYTGLAMTAGSASTAKPTEGTNSSGDKVIVNSMTLSADRLIRAGNISVKLLAKNFGDAQPNDVVAGKTFTSTAGAVVTGTYTPSSGLDTSDATATADTILSGKTAYVKGSKVTGTCTYDADTSDATAAASDIASGKTAYVNGTKITGTATSSGGSSGLPSTITAGDTPVMASFTGSKITSSTVTNTNLSLTITKAGTYRFYVSASMASSYGTSQPIVYLYKNGTSVGSHSITSTTYSAVSFDVTCASGDVIKVYGQAAGSNWSSTPVTVISLVACIDWDNGM